MVLEDCELPLDALIGQEGQGLDLAFALLVKNRFPYAATNLGVAVAAHRMAIEHAKQRETFGQKLSQRQAIQWMLADAGRAARVAAGSSGKARGRPTAVRTRAWRRRSPSSIERLGRVVDAAVQIHGGSACRRSSAGALVSRGAHFAASAKAVGGESHGHRAVAVPMNGLMLEGVLVVEIGANLAGPVAGEILAHMGRTC